MAEQTILDLLDDTASTCRVEGKGKHTRRYTLRNDHIANICEMAAKHIRCVTDEIEQLRSYRESKEHKRLLRDKELLDYLVGEKAHDHARALFRRNMPITRGAIAAAIYEYPQTTKDSAET